MWHRDTKLANVAGKWCQYPCSMHGCHKPSICIKKGRGRQYLQSAEKQSAIEQGMPVRKSDLEYQAIYLGFYNLLTTMTLCKHHVSALDSSPAKWENEVTDLLNPVSKVKKRICNYKQN